MDKSFSSKNFNPIQFGSWMGGDRDGNLNVLFNVYNTKLFCYQDG